MKILAIDSSGMPASVAVCEGAVLLAEYTVNFKRTHSQTLVPMMDEVRRMLDLDLESIDAVAVAGGPGSFTGLRIGSAVAKGVGLAMDKPLIHVPTLEALAYNYYGSPELIVPMLDARNHQVFAGIYTFRSSGNTTGTQGDETEVCGDAEGSVAADSTVCVTNGQESAGSTFRVVNGQEPVGVISLCERLNAMSEEMDKKIILLGDGACAYRNLIEEKLTAPHAYAPAHMSQQRAGSVAVRGMELAMQGRLETAAMHRPEYLRVSQAERVRAQKLEAVKSDAS